MQDWIISTTFYWYATLLPFAQLALLVSVVFLLPLALFRRTRVFSGTLLFALSYLFGATIWLLGAGITVASFGWLGLIVGLLVFGIGVVPLGIIGAYFKLNMLEISVSLIVMSIITYGARAIGITLANKLSADDS